VIAFGSGGALETIIPGRTGEFFAPLSAAALADVLSDFDPTKYKAEDCIQNAARFSKKKFVSQLKKLLD